MNVEQRYAAVVEDKLQEIVAAKINSNSKALAAAAAAAGISSSNAVAAESANASTLEDLRLRMADELQSLSVARVAMARSMEESLVVVDSLGNSNLISAKSNSMS